MQEQQLCALSVPQGVVELRRYAWTKPEFLTFHRDDYMLSRVVSRTGGGRQQIGWRLPCAGKPVSALQVSVVAPESPVEVAFDPGEALVISCILDPGYFEDATGISQWSERHSLACLGLKSPVIDLIFERLAYEARAARTRADGAVETWIDALAGELSRKIERSLGGQTQGQLAAWQLEQIFSLARHPCGERRLTIKEIAYACEVSSRHLMRAFRATTGLTLHQFLNEARMQRAMVMLQSSDTPIKIVAGQLGFSTPSTFSAAFLQTVGTTPRDYRARFRKE